MTGAVPNAMPDVEVITMRRGALSKISGQHATVEQHLLVVAWDTEDGIAQPVTLGACTPGAYRFLRVGKTYYGLDDRLGVVFNDYRQAIEPFHEPARSEPAPALTVPSVGEVGDHWGVGDGPPSGVIGEPQRKPPHRQVPARTYPR
jgi:hypothetical protein